MKALLGEHAEIAEAIRRLLRSCIAVPGGRFGDLIASLGERDGNVVPRRRRK
jgi:hypothetical protein